ncbi:hypothetical protein [Cyanothece sp. BG0011]|uniref:hypothetical protein n=1 Tax=Cyanothece sp. BG0011 TaxID=2082950 RepID=UPI000D1D9318|nr:hypothetical protein [Cyanothece sp. BG0011]
MSKATRLKKHVEKAQNFKGFGSPLVSEKCSWFEIEYLSEDDLLELHWLKVSHPNKGEKKRLRANMQMLGYDEPGASEMDFLALLYSGTTNPPEGTKETCLYRATKCYQSNTIKKPISVIVADERAEINNLYVKSLLFKYCKVVAIIPGERVTLTCRK